MSRRTQAKHTILVFMGFVAIFSSPFLISGANAGPAVTEAQEKLNKAYDDYYDAVSKGGQKSADEQKALRQKIVDPAMTNLNQAMKQETDDVVREHAKDLPPSMKKNLPADATAIAGSSAPVLREHTQDATLDGADIPREIEFPGKTIQPKASPAVAPSILKVDPYLGPYAPKSR